MTLQEHLRVILCHLTLCQIIQSKFSAIIYINYILDEIQEIYTIEKGVTNISMLRVCFHIIVFYNNIWYICLTV